MELKEVPILLFWIIILGTSMYATALIAGKVREQVTKTLRE